MFQEKRWASNDKVLAIIMDVINPKIKEDEYFNIGTSIMKF